ncbi:hypothetical protein K439DRAFT_1645956 [Ramaria rubella]|nr:hypothetical protein K439DRAFT_1645956 [Ramaria rubella]
MPPPAPPADYPNPQQMPSCSSTMHSGSSSTSVSPDIAPMTPARVLNLRRLSTGLIPPLTFANAEKTENMVGPGPGAGGPARKLGKGKAAPAPRGRRGPGFSPNLKPLLPGGMISLLPHSLQSNVYHDSTGVPPTPTLPFDQRQTSIHTSTSVYPIPGAGQGPRKTSHKAAEQKRRDSLKTSYDDLRKLLPPVPLLLEDTGDDPPLPGSMPPRGPPKGDAEGPNRGVSKLALLRCANKYIKELKEKVERRDGEIEMLRGEVRRLRAVRGDAGVEREGGELDLERDVDEGMGMGMRRANDSPGNI